jgi:phage baseplate assembly protein V
MVAAMARNLDPEAAAGEVLRLGTIASVDHANATCTVESGDILTGDIPWIAQRAGKVRHWSPPSVGEQCLLLAPEGDLAAGMAIVGLYSDACPPPSTDPNLILVEYDD